MTKIQAVLQLIEVVSNLIWGEWFWGIPVAEMI